MGVWQWALIALNLVLASLSLSAATMARSYLQAVRKLLDAASSRSLIELEAAVASLESAQSVNSTTLRRLSSRIGMQDVRARQKAESEPELTPSERKARLRRDLATGKLRVVRDNPSTTAE